MPEYGVQIGYFANPAVTLGERIQKHPAAKDVHVVSAWYDSKGKLHLQAVLAQKDQQKLVDDAISAMLQDSQNVAMLYPPRDKEEEREILLDPVTFGGEASAQAFQKKLIERARKENKPALRHVRLTNVVPSVIVNDKKEIATDDEGNPRYFFRVTGRLLEIGQERQELENELIDWLMTELPPVTNPDQSPIEPKLQMQARPSPIFALQERAVQRGLDGAVFTDAFFDEMGKLEIAGRLHQPGDADKQAIETAVKELLTDDAPWTLAMKPHEANKDGKPIAWSATVRECQAKLAADGGLGQRIRLDRLYFQYVNAKLKLHADGAFLATPAESPTAALTRAIDATIVTRGKAEISTAGIMTITDPSPDLQNVISQRPDLDGTVLTFGEFRCRWPIAIRRLPRPAGAQGGRDAASERQAERVLVC